MLSYCSYCKEDSVFRKEYQRKSDGKPCAVYICLNKGCNSRKGDWYVRSVEQNGLNGRG